MALQALAVLIPNSSSPWSHGRRPAIRLPLLAYKKVSEIF